MSGDAGAMLPVVLKQLRDLVEAAQRRCDAGHSPDCEYAIQTANEEPEVADQVDEETECDCGDVELQAALTAVRASGVLG